MIEIKTCSKCGETKLLTEFSKCGSGCLHSYCKSCGREMNRNHYRNNKEYYYNKNKRKRKQIRDFIQKDKVQRGCFFCGEKHLACLDYHHLNGKDKNEDILISNLCNKGWSLERVQIEINKCIVICSNCHRKYHYDKIHGSSSGRMQDFESCHESSILSP